VQNSEDNYPFLGFNMTKKQRRIHAALMWCVCVISTLLDMSLHYGPNYEIGGWYFYPPMLMSYFLLYDTLPWNINRKLFDFKAMFKNVIVYMCISFLALLFSGFLFVLFLYNSGL
jgi:hypothetical protein